MDWFDAANFTMSSVATGGFSTYNDSTEYFHSPAIDYATTFFCFLSGTNFTLLYMTFFKRKWKSLFKDSEFRFYVIVVSLATAFIMGELIFRNHYAVEHAFRSAIFPGRVVHLHYGTVQRQCGDMAACDVGRPCGVYVLWSVLGVDNGWIEMCAVCDDP